LHLLRLLAAMMQDQSVLLPHVPAKPLQSFLHQRNV
jgi:hypothetical protein